MRTIIVHGAPMSGKSTYVQKHKGPNDLIFDFDLIMSALAGKPIHEHNDNLISYVLDIRDLIIARLKSEESIDTAWIITTLVPEKLKQSLVGLNPEYREMKISIHEARRRLRENPGNRDVDTWNKVIDKYFSITADYSSFYKSKRWQRKRLAVLKRDEFKCREASRFGKVVPANTVHHCIPLAERPDLKLDDRNLISLSEENHSRMHLKVGTGLSRLGKEWRERVVRRYPEIARPPEGEIMW